MKLLTLTFFLSLFLMLNGCAKQVDPHHDGFISGVGAVLTGKYDQRLQKKNNALAAAQAERSALKSAAAAAIQEKEEVSGALEQITERMNRLSQATGRLRSELQSERTLAKIAQSRQAVLLQKVEGLEYELDRLSLEGTLPVQKKKKQLEALQQRKARLQETLDDLLE